MLSSLHNSSVHIAFLLLNPTNGGMGCSIERYRRTTARREPCTKHGTLCQREAMKKVPGSDLLCMACDTVCGGKDGGAATTGHGGDAVVRHPRADVRPVDGRADRICHAGQREAAQ